MGLRIVNGVPYFDADSTFGDGTRACSKCMRRPARPKVHPRGRQQSYCRQCATEAMRKTRQGKVSMLLTPEERALIVEIRSAVPSGRHHARLAVQRNALRSTPRGEVSQSCS